MYFNANCVPELSGTKPRGSYVNPSSSRHDDTGSSSLSQASLQRTILCVFISTPRVMREIRKVVMVSPGRRSVSPLPPLSVRKDLRRIHMQVRLIVDFEKGNRLNTGIWLLELCTGTGIYRRDCGGT